MLYNLEQKKYYVFHNKVKYLVDFNLTNVYKYVVEKQLGCQNFKPHTVVQIPRTMVFFCLIDNDN